MSNIRQCNARSSQEVVSLGGGNLTHLKKYARQIGSFQNKKSEVKIKEKKTIENQRLEPEKVSTPHGKGETSTRWARIPVINGVINFQETYLILESYGNPGTSLWYVLTIKKSVVSSSFDDSVGTFKSVCLEPLHHRESTWCGDN